MSRIQRFQNYTARSNTNVRWVIAHGEHTNASLLQSFRVPDGVYISFVSEPGRLLSKNIIYHPTFVRLHRSIYLTKRFIKKEIPITHLPHSLQYFYGNSPRIYFPNEYVPNIELNTRNSDPYTNFFMGVKSLKKHSKSFINTQTHLSDVITRPGIYFVIACRQTPGGINRTVLIRRQESSLANMLRKRPRNTGVRRNESPPAKRRA